MEVIELNKDNGKHLCVFNVVNNAAGMVIEKEMRQWLTDNYHVYEVIHDGTQYECPGLKFMQELCAETGAPCLYIHTKGAFHTKKNTPCVRRMWKEEFTKNKEKYFRAVETESPKVSCPFSGATKHTWYNGFVANAAAMAALPEITPSRNRFDFECMWGGIDVPVVGLIINDIGSVSEVAKARTYLLNKYLK